MTPNARFQEFIKDITPSPTTMANSKSAHESVRMALKADKEFKDKFKRVFIGGSYKRSTAIRPRTKQGSTERPDVDLYVVVDGHPWFADPEEWIDDLYDALNRARKDLGITKIKRNRCSIALSMNKADVDVSILLERRSDGLYRIGNRTTGEWYKTDPEEHTEWSAAENKRFSGRFNAMVRMVKWARRENKTVSRHPKSFQLEMFVAPDMDMSETHYGQLFHDWCDAFVDRFKSNRDSENCPRIEDPAVPGADILAGVSDEAFCVYYDKIKKHRDDARKALDADNQDKAITYWRRIFGDRFPKPKTASGGTKRSATRMSPLSFKSAQAAPISRPAKFA
ncbi:SMODS domain-containing nucleotidyltransferase [Parvularcula oceani]|uniref:SMODS domain-containing nucleotidyltransferase n=1 Tax=Parvularcula oceani TaxID=1247963 RepID=UPI0004E11346|nr:nucleotidyltransferase [Parvularcula oceani]